MKQVRYTVLKVKQHRLPLELMGRVPGTQEPQESYLRRMDYVNGSEE